MVGLLVLLGQSVAFARGAPVSAGQIILCTGSGLVMVHVDADGQPLDTPRFCPDGAHGLLQAIALAPGGAFDPEENAGPSEQGFAQDHLSSKSEERLNRPRGPPSLLARTT